MRRPKRTLEETREAGRASRRRNAQRLTETKEVTAALKESRIKFIRGPVDDLKLSQLQAQFPDDDLRDLTGILMGDPWPNDQRRFYNPNEDGRIKGG